MIALCPNCRARIRIEMREVVDRNLVRCSQCWFVFIVAADEMQGLQKKDEKLSRVVGEDLSQRFSEWEKQALDDAGKELLEDVSLSRPFDWTGFEDTDNAVPGAARQETAAEDEGGEVGEGTILSWVKEKPGAVTGDVLCTLSVVDGPQAGLTIPVQQRSVILGREMADCVINDPEVSRQHARIRVTGENGSRRFEIEDLGSTNGTIVNGTRVEFSPIDNCDEISLGSTRIIFFVGKPMVLTPRPALDEKALAHMGMRGGAARAKESSPSDPDGTQTMGAGNPFLPNRLPQQLRASLEVVGGPDRGMVIDFPKGAVVIGRDQADVCLKDPQVSRKHAIVEILGKDQIFLKDLASKNGTIVNGILVKIARLQSGDSIEMGDTKLVFSAEAFG